MRRTSLPLSGAKSQGSARRDIRWDGNPRRHHDSDARGLHRSPAWHGHGHREAHTLSSVELETGLSNLGIDLSAGEIERLNNLGGGRALHSIAKIGSGIADDHDANTTVDARGGGGGRRRRMILAARGSHTPLDPAFRLAESGRGGSSRRTGQHQQPVEAAAAAAATTPADEADIVPVPEPAAVTPKTRYAWQKSLTEPANEGSSAPLVREVSGERERTRNSSKALKQSLTTSTSESVGAPPAGGKRRPSCFVPGQGSDHLWGQVTGTRRSPERLSELAERALRPSTVSRTVDSSATRALLAPHPLERQPSVILDNSDPDAWAARESVAVRMAEPGNSSSARLRSARRQERLVHHKINERLQANFAHDPYKLSKILLSHRKPNHPPGRISGDGLRRGLSDAGIVLGGGDFRRLMRSLSQTEGCGQGGSLVDVKKLVDTVMGQGSGASSSQKRGAREGCPPVGGPDHIRGQLRGERPNRDDGEVHTHARRLYDDDTPGSAPAASKLWGPNQVSTIIHKYAADVDIGRYTPFLPHGGTKTEGDGSVPCHTGNNGNGDGDGDGDDDDRKRPVTKTRNRDKAIMRHVRERVLGSKRLGALQKQLAAISADGSGLVTPTQFSEVLRTSLDMQLGKEDLHALLSTVRTDDDGNVKFADFVAQVDGGSRRPNQRILRGHAVARQTSAAVGDSRTARTLGNVESVEGARVALSTLGIQFGDDDFNALMHVVKQHGADAKNTVGEALVSVLCDPGQAWLHVSDTLAAQTAFKAPRVTNEAESGGLGAYQFGLQEALDLNAHHQQAAAIPAEPSQASATFVPAAGSVPRLRYGRKRLGPNSSARMVDFFKEKTAGGGGEAAGSDATTPPRRGGLGAVGAKAQGTQQRLPERAQSVPPHLRRRGERGQKGAANNPAGIESAESSTNRLFGLRKDLNDGITGDPSPSDGFRNREVVEDAEISSRKRQAALSARRSSHTWRRRRQIETMPDEGYWTWFEKPGLHSQVSETARCISPRRYRDTLKSGDHPERDSLSARQDAVEVLGPSSQRRKSTDPRSRSDSVGPLLANPPDTNSLCPLSDADDAANVFGRLTHRRHDSRDGTMGPTPVLVLSEGAAALPTAVNPTPMSPARRSSSGNASTMGIANTALSVSDGGVARNLEKSSAFRHGRDGEAAPPPPPTAMEATPSSTAASGVPVPVAAGLHTVERRCACSNRGKLAAQRVDSNIFSDLQYPNQRS